MSVSPPLLDQSSIAFVPNFSQLDSKGRSKTVSDDECTAFLQLRLFDRKNSRLLEEWFADILAAMQEWQRGAWKGRIILRPPPEATKLDYVCMFRFRSWRLMSKWLKSSQRAHFIAKLESLKICESISSDLQEGLACFLPDSMRLAGWKSLSGSATEVQEELGASASGGGGGGVPAAPPKWRSCIIIWLALQFTVLPWMLFLDTRLAATGLPLFWRVVLSLVLIVPTVDYFIVPALDRACHCCLYAPRCPAVEPCLSLQIGFPCGCRRQLDPTTQSEIVVEERFRELEHQLQLQRRLQGAAQRRLVGRMEMMEQGMLEVLKRGKEEGVREEGGEEEEEEEDMGSSEQSVAVSLDASLERVALLASSKSGGDDESSDESVQEADGPVTICIAYRVKSRCVIQFEEWVHEMARQASTRVAGFRGEVVCQTPDAVFQSDSETMPTHLVLFQFDTQENLKTWASHSARRHMMLRLRPLLKENSLAKVKVASIGSFGNVMDLAWHVGGGGGGSTVGSDHSNTGAGTAALPVLRHDPQRWKMVIIVALALLLEIWYIGIPVVGSVMTGVPRWLLIMVDTFIGVQILTYFLLPLLIYACKGWLFVPWVESSNGCCAFLQRGCFCWVDR
jgi:antibiotic biosynthesis monooxygenase (ABM) superfamily enzyme